MAHSIASSRLSRNNLLVELESDEKIDPLLCPYCGQKFVYQSRLVLHLQRDGKKMASEFKVG
jgi:DNA-directed RNA polymerase subunit RPC12/RpoP